MWRKHDHCLRCICWGWFHCVHGQAHRFDIAFVISHLLSELWRKGRLTVICMRRPGTGLWEKRSRGNVGLVSSGTSLGVIADAWLKTLCPPFRQAAAQFKWMWILAVKLIVKAMSKWSESVRALLFFLSVKTDQWIHGIMEFRCAENNALRGHRRSLDVFISKCSEGWFVDNHMMKKGRLDLVI